MRYFKSATFLLLTASSSVSLLSHAAMAASPKQSTPEPALDEPQPVKSETATPVTAQSETTHLESVSLDEIRREATASLETNPAAADSPYAFANSAQTRSPQFSNLLRRLYPTSFAEDLIPDEETLSAESSAAEGSEVALNELSDSANELSDSANELSDSAVDSTEVDSAEVDSTETKVDDAFSSDVSAQVVTVEVVAEPSFTEAFAEVPKEETSSEIAQTSGLTLDDLRSTPPDADRPNGDVPAANEPSADQLDADENLPTLEEAPPSASPDNAADEGLPEIAPDADSETPADNAPPASPADADESDNPVENDPIPAPAVQNDAELNELPAILFADPNPLSFPTAPEEVDVDRTPLVTLEQAIELAYQNNQTLQSSLLQLEQAAAALREAEAARLPTVSTGADVTNTQNDGSRTVLGGSVELGYNLLTGGARSASIRAAELQQDVSALAVEAQQEQIRLVTANAYYALQDAGEQIRINQSFLDEAARNLRDSQLRQEVGVGTRFDTLRAEVQFANARQSLIQSQGDQRIARRDIARVLNLPPTTGIEATPVAVAETWPLTLEDSILLAFQNRAELEQQLLQADISEEQRKIALSAIRPQLSLFARYTAQEILEGTTAFEEDFADSFAIGAQFSWTLYDGGASRASARQQEIGSQLAEEQFSENLDQVRFDVEQAFFNLQSNQENIATSEVAVAQAEEALELANLRLQAGVGTQLDVLTAQSELTQAEANNVTAILGYNRALVAMERAVSNVTAPF